MGTLTGEGSADIQWFEYVHVFIIPIMLPCIIIIQNLSWMGVVDELKY